MRHGTKGLGRRRTTWIVGGLLVLGLGGAGAGTGFAALSGDGKGGAAAPGQVLTVEQSAGCSALTKDIAAGKSADKAKAIDCDQQEFSAMETLRQQARARGEKPAMGNSPTCTAVN